MRLSQEAYQLILWIVPLKGAILFVTGILGLMPPEGKEYMIKHEKNSLSYLYNQQPIAT